MRLSICICRNYLNVYHIYHRYSSNILELVEDVRITQIVSYNKKQYFEAILNLMKIFEYYIIYIGNRICKIVM